MTREQRINEANISRVVEGLRDTGYSFPAAVSDLIDNSIEAGATAIDVVVVMEGNDPSQLVFWLADNGRGMTEEEVENAMKYGADAVEDIHRLGKYGLGMKTASTSFCRRMTVLSKKGRGKAKTPPVAATWDLDVIKETNEWICEYGVDDDLQELFKEAMEGVKDLTGSKEEVGTVVVWEKIDRLLMTKLGSEATNLKRALNTQVKNLVEHAEMVFQRFLDPQNTDVPQVSIRVNDKVLEPWDPFCEHFGIKPVQTKQWRVGPTEEELSDVSMRAFILPKPEEFDDTGEADRYEKYRKTAVSARQGLFVYREDRLLEEGKWYGMGSDDTHLKALRIEVNFTADADELFGVGMKKQGLQLKDELVEVLSEVVPGLRADANRLDRSGNAKKAANKKNGVREVDRAIGRRQKNLTTAKLSGEGQSVTLENVHTETPWSIVEANGQTAIEFPIPVVDGEEQVKVELAETVDSAALWQPNVVRSENARHVGVVINTSHEWFVRAYAPNEPESTTTRALDLLLWALANAEANNVKEGYAEWFEEFRIEVSRNLRDLAKDLPEYHPDD